MTAVDKSASDKANPTGEARAAKLIAWFNAGAGGKIIWGKPGDFDACVRIAGKHMTPAQARGFCNERHQDATGHPPGKHGPGGAKVRKAGRLALLRRLLSAHPATKVPCPSCGEETSAFAGACPACGAVVGIEAKKAAGEADDVAKGEHSHSAMVALYPSAGAVSALAIEGGEAPGQLHLTVKFLGDTAEWSVVDRQRLIGIVAEFAAHEQPFDAEVTGVGQFAPNGEGETPHVALVSGPDLSDMRERLVAKLTEAGLVAE
jgi:hypothetical protein